MEKSNVEQIIQELATQNFNMYNESYPIENNLATDEATENAQELAISYFEHRNESEIVRDNNLSITKIDYIDFVMSAFSTWVQEEIEA